jgi:hypothetical protein
MYLHDNGDHIPNKYSYKIPRTISSKESITPQAQDNPEEERLAENSVI